jgi:hypothetical protein
VASIAASGATALSAPPAGAQLQDVAIAGAISRALVVISRHEQQQHSSRRRARHRVLVVQASRDGPGQYIPVMNAIFAAQKAEVGTLLALALALLPAARRRGPPQTPPTQPSLLPPPLPSYARWPSTPAELH